MRRLAWTIAAVLSGCGDGSGGTGRADAGTDADSDTDVDSDTDSDSDADVVWSERLSEGIARGVSIDGEGRVAVAADQDGGFVDDSARLWMRAASGDAAGDLVFDSKWDDHVRGLATDEAGNLYVTGDLGEVADLGSGVAARGSFVASYGADGAHRWDVRLPMWVGGVTIDPAGQVVVAGCFEDAQDFGGGERTSEGQSDPAVVTLASGDGAYVGDAIWGTPNDECALDVAVVEGGLVVAGGTDDTDALLVAWDAGGTLAWQKTLAGAKASVFDEIVGVAADAGGFVAVGTYTPGLDFGGGPREADAVTGSGFLAAFGTDGAWRWDRPLVDGSAAFLDVAAAGDVVVAVGDFIGRVSLDETHVVETPELHDEGFDVESDALVVAWGSDGAYRWHTLPNVDLEAESLSAVAIGANGAIAFAGTGGSIEIPIVFAGVLRAP